MQDMEGHETIADVCAAIANKLKNTTPDKVAVFVNNEVTFV